MKRDKIEREREKIDDDVLEGEDAIEIAASEREVRVRTWRGVGWVILTYLLCGGPAFLWLWVFSVGLPYYVPFLINLAILVPVWAVCYAWAWLYVKNFRAFITSKGVLVRWGAISRHRAMIHYHRLTDFSIHRGILYQMFDLSAVALQTAGTSTAEAVIIGQEDPHALIRMLKQKIEEQKSRDDGTDVVQARPLSNLLGKDQTQLLEEILLELREIKGKLG